MNHSFDIDIAKKYGIYAAVLLENISFWVKQNEANGTNFNDGYYWTYNSRRAYGELFPYMSKRQIEYAFKKLIDEGLILTGNFNKVAYDRTMWYTLTPKGKAVLHYETMENPERENPLPQNEKSISQNGEMENPERENGFDKMGEPIPVINTDINPVINNSCSSSDDDPEEDTFNKLEPFRKGVFLSDNQIEDLLNRMGLETFDYYVDKLADFIEKKGAFVKNHYETILKWYKEDSAVGVK